MITIRLLIKHNSASILGFCLIATFITLFSLPAAGFSSVYDLRITFEDDQGPDVINSRPVFVILGSTTSVRIGASHSDSAWVARLENFIKDIEPEVEVANLAVEVFNTFNVMRSDHIPPVGPSGVIQITNSRKLNLIK